MRGTTAAASNLARATLVLGMIGGCSAPPASTPPASAPPTVPVSTQAAATDAPGPLSSPTPTSSSRLNVLWEAIARPGDVGSIAYGINGWVALEDCGEAVCSPAANIWHSTDLSVWEEIPLPRSGDIIPISVSANSDNYLVAASDYDDVGDYGETFTQVWRSPDGRSWERVGELRSGACNIAGCPHPTNVGLAPSGSIFIGAIEPREGPESEPFLSEDGVRWQSVAVAGHSQGEMLERVFVAEVVSTPTDLLLIGEVCLQGTECRETVVTIWGSTDGEHWVEEQSFESELASIASDGVRRVATVTTCGATCEAEYRTDVWTGLPSGVWTNVAPALDLAYPTVVWTGDAFIIVGERLGESVGYASFDGQTWTELSHVPNGTDECGRRRLVGGSGVAVLGIGNCGMWKGTVLPAR